MRIRSPRIAPPEKGDDGSTAMMPTFRPRARALRASAAVSVDLPAPGEPVRPVTRAPPVRGKTSARSPEARIAGLGPRDRARDRRDAPREDALGEILDRPLRPAPSEFSRPPGLEWPTHGVGNSRPRPGAFGDRPRRVGDAGSRGGLPSHLGGRGARPPVRRDDPDLQRGGTGFSLYTIAGRK